MWQIERKISLPTIVMMASYLIGGIWFAAIFFAEMQGMKAEMQSVKSDVKQALQASTTNRELTIRLETKQEEVARSLERIESYLQPRFSRIESNIVMK